MWNTKRITGMITRGIKIFFIGLLLQFFLHTFVTFTLGRENTLWKIIWAWKEIWILLAGCIIVRTGYKLQQQKKLQAFIQTFPLKKYSIIIILTSLVILLAGTITSNAGLSATLMSRRYSMLGFVIFVIGALIALRRQREGEFAREKRYTQLMKYLLIGGIIWRWLIYFLPAFIELFGYNKYVYEGQVGQQPPAVYYSNITQGMVRNQFLFERPIHRAMFLIALRPLFFLIAIKNKSTSSQILRGSLYGLNIISTLSRAAWIAWIIQTAVLLLILHHKNIKKLILYGFIPGIIILAGITYRAKDDIIYRNFSNLGHIKHTMAAIQKVGQKPFVGRGPGFAGPASHHRKDVPNYNPENQYLQIRIEYGIVGFIGWLYLYLRLHVIGYRSYRKLQQEKLTKEQRYHSRIMVALSLGLLGLSIEGFFLHSFVDRMIVYPIMLLFGICFGIYHKVFNHDAKQREQ